MSETGTRRSTLNRSLAAVAFVLGIGAVALGDPYGGHVVTLNTKELAAIVETEVDHVAPEELADWIIQGRTDYRLLDLRDEASYAEYHIPGAERVPISELPDHPLFRNEKVVLYSGGGIHSAQGWFLLKAQGLPGAYILLGGLDAWIDDVLFPAIPGEPTPEQLVELARLRRVSEYFGGKPRTGSDDTADTAAVPLPKVEMPAAPVVTKKKKRKKEGC